MGDGIQSSASRGSHQCLNVALAVRGCVFTFVTLVFLAGRAFAETNADAPTGKPDAVIDLATKEGVDLVKGQWRYSDTKIIPVDFKAAGPDKQPTGKPIKTYDFTPHAGGVDFDDSKWEMTRSDDTRCATLDRPALFQLVPNQHHYTRRA